MNTSQEILKLYKKYNVSASKRFGQNFLHNQEILNKIINSINLKDKHVIEIGPGLGSLTKPLLKNSQEVSSYEIDQDMIKVLKGEIKEKNFNLIEGDFLDANLDWENRRPIVANIPYNITSDILFKLFKNSKRISEAVIMIQKEVGERLLAKVGSKNYGKLTVTTELFADVEKIVIVPAESFIPAPKVTSIVIKLIFKDSYFDKELLDFIKKCFAQRRKTLFNNLRNFMDSEKAKKIMIENSLSDSVRPQNLSKDQFLVLYKLYK